MTHEWANQHKGGMKPEVRDEWIAELESGKYIQNRGALHTVDEGGTHLHCCLGVLCEVAVKHEIIPQPTEMSAAFRSGVDYQYGVEYDVSVSVLPKVVRDWAGISNENGSYSGDEALSAHNDNGMSFDTIAQIIRDKF